MASYSIRVVLHGASSKDFDNLHGKMQALGCSRTISDSASGEVFDLPDGNYQLYSDISAINLRDRVKTAADAICSGSSVLVVEANNQVWHLRQPPAQS